VSVLGIDIDFTPSWQWLWYLSWAGMYIALMYWQWRDYEQRVSHLTKREDYLDNKEDRLLEQEQTLYLWRRGRAHSQEPVLRIPRP
jgi:hypothetical protein